METHGNACGCVLGDAFRSAKACRDILSLGRLIHELFCYAHGGGGLFVPNISL